MTEQGTRAWAIGAGLLLILGAAAVGASLALLKTAKISAAGLASHGPIGAPALLIGFASLMGLASMAILQLVKNVLGARGRFHRQALRGWLHERELGFISPDMSYREAADLARAGHTSAFHQLLDAVGVPTKPDQRRGRQRLIGRVRPPERQPFFDLPLEQLCGQIGAAADLALTVPVGLARLLAALAGPSAHERVWELLEDADRRNLTSDQSRLLSNRGLSGAETQMLLSRERFSAIERQLIERGDWGPKDKDQLLAGRDPTSDEIMERRGVVGYHIQRGVDALQASIGYQWRWYIRASASGLSGLLGLAIMTFATAPAKTAFVLVSLLLGGFFASVARDLAAAVERIRR